MSNELEYRKEHVKQINKWLGNLNSIQNIIQSPLLNKDEGLLEEINKLESMMGQRLERVRQNTARVSVIGLEKQGKSTFVNAWIGKQCLPSDSKRCTWASSTLINANDFSAKIEFLTTAEFEKTVDGLFEQLNIKRNEYVFPLSESAKNELKTKVDVGHNAYKDLEQLSKHYSEIRNYLDHSPKSVKADSIQEFNDKLFEWISLRSKEEGNENGKAYSVKHCDINLPIEEGLVFSIDDLPGIDAPGNRAEIMTWDNVEKHADIIVLVKSAFNNASMNANEIKIWDKANASDNAIKLTEKLFVLLNQADADKIEHGRDAHEEAYKEFHQDRFVPENRIFYASSRAELYKNNQGDLSFDWTEEEYSKARLAIANKRKQSEPTTGFDEFKHEIYNFLKNDFKALEEKALRYLETEYAKVWEKWQVFLSNNKIDELDNGMNEDAMNRFSELWYPQTFEKEGLAHKINKKSASMIEEIIGEPEKAQPFIDALRGEIHKSRERMLEENTVENFEARHDPKATALHNMTAMRQHYFEFMQKKIKREISEELSRCISKNVNSHIKSIWDESLQEVTEEAPHGLSVIGDEKISDFLKKKNSDYLFTNFNNEKNGQVSYGFSALLKATALSTLEYLLSSDPDLDDCRAKILYKTKVYEDGINNARIGSTLKSLYNQEIGAGTSPASAISEVVEKIKDHRSSLRIMVDLLLPKPFDILADLMLNATEKYSKAVEAEPEMTANVEANPFDKKTPFKTAPTKAVNPTSSGDSNPFGKSKTEPKDSQPREISQRKVTPEGTILEMERRIKLVYHVLEVMLFDDEFGFVGYYRSILEEFRVSIFEQMTYEPGIIRSLAFNHCEQLFPNESIFKKDNDKEMLKNILKQAQEIAK